MLRYLLFKLHLKRQSATPLQYLATICHSHLLKPPSLTVSGVKTSDGRLPTEIQLNNIYALSLVICATISEQSIPLDTRLLPEVIFTQVVS